MKKVGLAEMGLGLWLDGWAARQLEAHWAGLPMHCPPEYEMQALFVFHLSAYQNRAILPSILSISSSANKVRKHNRQSRIVNHNKIQIE